MLSEILAKWFEEAKREAWQGYGIVGFPPPEDDHRQICFNQLLTSIDAMPELLSDQTKPYRTVSEIWFEREVRNLGERVGWDFFPETAAEFVWRLLGILSRSAPDSFTLMQIERQHAAWTDHDIPFCDPRSDVTA